MTRPARTANRALRPSARARRHGAVLGPPPRRSLERAGWRTTLEFRENHMRSLDGRLLRAEQVWLAEAERYDDLVVVARVEAASPDDAWRLLLEQVETGRVERYQRVKLA